MDAIDKVRITDSPLLTLPAPSVEIGTGDEKWRCEYEAFLRIKPHLLATNAGRYVVVHHGQVIDSGTDEVALALRFFEQHGNQPVHIGLVAEAPEQVSRIPHYRQV